MSADEIEIHTEPGWPSECGKCGSMIARGAEQAHRAWHAELALRITDRDKIARAYDVPVEVVVARPSSDPAVCNCPPGHRSVPDDHGPWCPVRYV